MIGSINSSDSSYIPLVRCSGGESSCGPQENSDKSLSANDVNSKNNVEVDKENAETGTSKSSKAPNQLNEAELAMVRELKQRDRQVRQHEMAHLAASGGLAQGGPRYTYQRGPDGQNYAIGGHVNIDTSPGKTPEETLQKARTIQAAAMAPADPSGQDRAVAAKASQMAANARVELSRQSTTGQGGLTQRNEDSRQPTTEQPGSSQRNEDTPAHRLARQIFSAITPQLEPFIQLTA
ncbi:MAG: hypothetical protein KDJ22_07325 [Candidatus Competibacteraceae bacterium]|nr:hypothetical protein [Candidatus Competibacteraceae bacterium]MCP5127777.1 hypothetical protein [Gammaproteobacteria bacterium]HRX70121.1 putative metalloprotease CJM1_0395 family protein [Candidatus Competibacteraceae bacterium]